MVGRVGETVNHDRAAGSPALLVCAQLVLFIRIGNLNGQKEIAAGIAPRQEITPFRSPKVAFTLLLTHGAQSQRNFVSAQKAVAVVQKQLVFGFVDDYAV